MRQNQTDPYAGMDSPSPFADEEARHRILKARGGWGMLFIIITASVSILLLG